MSNCIPDYSPMLIALLFVAIILGLGLFLVLVRQQRVPFLLAGVVVLLAVGLGILRLLPMDVAENPSRVIFALILLWLGWVGLMAWLAQWLGSRAPASHPWPVVGCGAATLAPVLGLLVARLVS